MHIHAHGLPCAHLQVSSVPGPQYMVKLSHPGEVWHCWHENCCVVVHDAERAVHHGIQLLPESTTCQGVCCKLQHVTACNIGKDNRSTDAVVVHMAEQPVHCGTQPRQ